MFCFVSSTKTLSINSLYNCTLAGGIPPWKESFRDAIPVNSVGELLQSKDQYHGKLVCLISSLAASCVLFVLRLS